ncbi:MAG: type I-C CRISPR-associated protein Cas8c/Csd1 [Spirochaetaceae bacterium 4572_59]|nr:MAG: type I-C CRISPR-associated protein Cas8c/Csd1 [Spirochaetaceae bacterium 4572_59]
MIKELVDFGKTKRTGHDALKDEPISIDLVIDIEGNFHEFAVIDKIFRPAEALKSKKGKARLLLDKCEEVLGYSGVDKKELDSLNEKIAELNNDDRNKKKDAEKAINAATKKHALYLEKLENYSELKELEPVRKFYKENKTNGLDLALDSFVIQVDEKERSGNIAFRIFNERTHEMQAVYDAIIEKFIEDQQSSLVTKKITCSICGTSDYPVIDEPHGMIKKVPNGQTAGSALVSYNENAFESYSLKGNLNSAICTNCAKNYTEGLNWLLSNGSDVEYEQKGKIKSRFRYSNRKNFGSDTSVIFWTRNNAPFDELSMLDDPNPAEISSLLESVACGKSSVGEHLESDSFYSCTLSGAAARIFVRDWIELSLDEYKKNIAQWFKDISIRSYGETHYTPLYALANAGHNNKSKTDKTGSRVESLLWNVAIKHTVPPLWIITGVLKRIRYIENNENGEKQETLTTERAALIRLILNRNAERTGGQMISEELDIKDKRPAIICGRIFATMEAIQRAALGKELNAGIRERFFSFASTNPAPAFGRLMKMSQNHITKLKHEKPGLAVILDRQLQELCVFLGEFPVFFSLEEQGQFALGYYHQKQKSFDDAQKNKELKVINEPEEKE